MAEDFKYDVFISHNKEDSASVRQLAERLQRDGMKVWLDHQEIEPGREILDQIREGLKHSRVLVFCLSANTANSDWMQFAANTFRLRNLPNNTHRFIPLLLDDTLLKGSLAQFTSIHWNRNRQEEYLKLLEACQKPISAKSENKPAKKTTEQTEFDVVYAIEDLLHQLKTPVLQAEMRAKRALQMLYRPSESQTFKEILAIKGLCAKASRVMRQGRLLAELQMGRSVSTNRSPLTYESMSRLAIEIAEDAAIVFSDREISCEVNRTSFEVLNRVLVFGDIDLVRAALDNLVDNAFKYSYANTLIEVDASLGPESTFLVTVSNVGIPLSPGESKKCATRGWRGERAQEVTGEGSGIGLWVTDNIMRGLGGKLSVSPTENRVTKMSLIFPITRKSQ